MLAARVSLRRKERAKHPQRVLAMGLEYIGNKWFLSDPS